MPGSKDWDTVPKTPQDVAVGLSPQRSVDSEAAHIVAEASARVCKFCVGTGPGAPPAPPCCLASYACPRPSHPPTHPPHTQAKHQGSGPAAAAGGGLAASPTLSKDPELALLTP